MQERKNSEAFYTSGKLSGRQLNDEQIDPFSIYDDPFADMATFGGELNNIEDQVIKRINIDGGQERPSSFATRAMHESLHKAAYFQNKQEDNIETKPNTDELYDDELLGKRFQSSETNSKNKSKRCLRKADSCMNLRNSSALNSRRMNSKNAFIDKIRHMLGDEDLRKKICFNDKYSKPYIFRELDQKIKKNTDLIKVASQDCLNLNSKQST